MPNDGCRRISAIPKGGLRVAVELRLPAGQVAWLRLKGKERGVTPSQIVEGLLAEALIHG